MASKTDLLLLLAILTLLGLYYSITTIADNHTPPPPTPPSPTILSQLETTQLSYRDQLVQRETIPHSKTLGFTKIYVLSLPNRTDRRNRMLKLGRALGVELEFVDAVDKNSKCVQWIGERVWETRERKAALMVSRRRRRRLLWEARSLLSADRELTDGNDAPISGSNTAYYSRYYRWSRDRQSLVVPLSRQGRSRSLPFRQRRALPKI